MQPPYPINSLEAWLELTVVVATSEIGVDLVLIHADQDRESGEFIGFGRLILEKSIRAKEFFYCPKLDWS